MRARFAILAMCCACAAEERSLWLDLPPLEGQQALVIAGPGGDTLDVRAYDLSKGTADLKITMPAAVLESGVIEALVYEQSLSELGIGEGTLREAASEEEASPLPEAGGVYRAAIDLDAPSAAWSPVVAPSRAIEEYRFADEQRCVQFQEPAAQTMIGAARWVVRIDDESILAGTRTGATLIVDRDQIQTITWGGIPVSAMRLPGDEVLLGDVGGQIFRARVSHQGGITDASPWGGDVRIGFPVLSIAGEAREDGTYEIYAITGFQEVVATPQGEERRSIDPQLHKNDGSGWIPLGPLANDTIGDLVYAGSGEVLIRSAETGTILSVKNGVASQMFLGSEISLTSLDVVEGTGVVAGSGQGLLYQRSGSNTWLNINDVAYGWWVLSAVAYHRGMMFLLASGSVVELDARRRSCPEVGSLGFIYAGAILELSASTLFVWGVESGETTFLFMPRAGG